MEGQLHVIFFFLPTFFPAQAHAAASWFGYSATPVFFTMSFSRKVRDHLSWMRLSQPPWMRWKRCPKREAVIFAAKSLIKHSKLRDDSSTAEGNWLQGTKTTQSEWGMQIRQFLSIQGGSSGEADIKNSDSNAGNTELRRWIIDGAPVLPYLTDGDCLRTFCRVASAPCLIGVPELSRIRCRISTYKLWCSN